MRDKHEQCEQAVATLALANAVNDLACVLSHINNNQAILNRLAQMEGNIMSAISEFAGKQKSFNDRQAAAIDSAVASVLGLTEDVKTLNDKITELQNSSGGVTPEDQALINELETQGEAVVAKAEAAAAALKALDEQTPPTVPPVPPA